MAKHKSKNKIQQMLHIFKICIKNLTPSCLSNKLEYSRDTHNRITCSINELRLPNFKTAENELPNEMKNETSIAKLKKALLN